MREPDQRLYYHYLNFAENFFFLLCIAFSFWSPTFETRLRINPFPFSISCFPSGFFFCLNDWDRKYPQHSVLLTSLFWFLKGILKSAVFLLLFCFFQNRKSYQVLVSAFVVRKAPLPTLTSAGVGRSGEALFPHRLTHLGGAKWIGIACLESHNSTTEKYKANDYTFTFARS